MILDTLIRNVKELAKVFWRDCFCFVLFFKRGVNHQKCSLYTFHVLSFISYTTCFKNLSDGCSSYVTLDALLNIIFKIACPFELYKDFNFTTASVGQCNVEVTI